MSDDENTQIETDHDVVIIMQGPLAELQRGAALLKRHGIDAAIGSSGVDDCCSAAKLWLEIAREDAQAAAEVFDRDWRAGLDEEQIAALQAASQIVIDPEASETTCPACLTTFATGPVECPECGLRVG
jgi:hypothetical protein